MNVGEVAAAAGVTVRTLHHWDAVGLLIPSGRTTAGYRSYDARDLQRLQSVAALVERAVEARSMGISLTPQEIREVFGEHDPTRQAEEAQQRWGDTDSYLESHRRTSSYDKADWVRIRAEVEDIERRFAQALAVDRGVHRQPGWSLPY